MVPIIIGHSEVWMLVSEDQVVSIIFTVTGAFYHENILQKIQFIKPNGVEQP